MEDKVNHPSHYTYGKIEVIDFILHLAEVVFSILPFTNE